MPGKRFRLPPRCRCGRTSAAATASPATRSARPPAARRSARPRPRPPPGPVRRAPARAAGCPATPPTSPAASRPPPARNTAVSSISPCGVSRPRKMSPLPASNMNPAMTPRLSGVLEEHVRDRDAEQDREARCTGPPPTSCSPTPAARTIRRGSRCSTTAKSWLTNSSISLGVLRAACTSGLPDTHTAISAVTKKNATAVPSHHRHDAVRDHRERHRPEPDELTPQRRVRTGDRRAGPATRPDSRPIEHRIGRRAAHHRQVGRHPLIKVDQLVDLRARQPPTPLDQLLEPVPRRTMRHHERVDIHQVES